MKTLIVVLMLLVCGFAVAQEVTYPKFVATVSSTGRVNLHDHDKTSQDPSRFSRYQITATTDCAYSFWRYDPNTSVYSLMAPAYGAATTDSTITLLAGESEFYVFAHERPTFMWCSLGTYTIKGE